MPFHERCVRPDSFSGRSLFFSPLAPRISPIIWAKRRPKRARAYGRSATAYLVEQLAVQEREEDGVANAAVRMAKVRPHDPLAAIPDLLRHAL